MITKRPRILIIDDDPMFRNLLVSLLRKDYLVAVAKDGKEGFDKAQEHTPDVAIIDIEMPEWDGLQTLKAFRKDPTLASVNVMILTASSSKETVVAAIQNGANEYVIKSTFDQKDFLTRISRLAEGKADRKPVTPTTTAPAAVPSPKHTASISKNAPSKNTAVESPVDELMESWE